MGAIVGIVRKKFGDIAQQVLPMLDAMQHRSSGIWKIAVDDIVFEPSSLQAENPKGKVAIGSLIKGSEGNANGFEKDGGLILAYDGEVFEKKASDHHPSLLKFLSTPSEDTIKGMIKKCREIDGVYALALADGKETMITRDPAGVRPLYFDNTSECAVFASEKKALWKVGMRDVRRLRAGSIARVEGDRLNVKRQTIEEIVTGRPVQEFEKGLDFYEKAFRSAVEKRIRGLDRAGVLISGGVDSTMVAKVLYGVAREKGIRLFGYTAGFADSQDVHYAKKFAHETGIRYTLIELNIDDVEKYIPKVIYAIEESDFTQVEAGIGPYAAVERAAQDDTRVIFSGQGPDELWGGYPWYRLIVGEEGYESFTRRSWEDLERADMETLERENKIAASHGVVMRLPYIDMEVIRVAMNASPSLKIYSGEDMLGKRLHRELAKRMGVPREYAERTKVAAQHGTGIHDIFSQIAMENGFDEELARKAGYDPESIHSDKMSSSARYGYRYTSGERWLVQDYVQLFLDMIAYENGLMNSDKADKLRSIRNEVVKHARIPGVDGN